MKLLIPLSYLNEACYLSQNIDEKKFKMCLKIAQEDLQDVLGKEFYEEIENQYDPINDTLTAANATLYDDYLKDYLAWDTYYRFLGFSQSDSTPTGERSFNDENSTLLGDIELHSKEKNVYGMVTRYKNRIINYLQNEQDKDSTAFPLWKNCNKPQFGWGISSIEKDSKKEMIYSVNKSIIQNE